QAASLLLAVATATTRRRSYPDFRETPARNPPGLCRGSLVAALVLLLGGCGPFMPEGEEILNRSGEDVVGAGRTVSFSDSVGGAAMLTGRTIAFSGTAAGSFLGAGEEVRIGGRTGAGALAAGGALLVGGTVGRNL